MKNHGDRHHPLRSPILDRRRATVAILLTMMCLGLATAVAAQEADEMPGGEWTVPALRPEAAAKADDILNAAYQAELPQARIRPMTERPRTALPDIFVKIALILGGILVVIVAMNLIFGTQRWARDGNGAEGAAAALGLDRFDLGDPEALAAEGRYAEAIHAMLLRALVLTAGRLDIVWPRSLTSREIMGSTALTEPARESLGALISRVEIHHFGGRPSQAEDYRHCRHAYEQLLNDPIKVPS